MIQKNRTTFKLVSILLALILLINFSLQNEVEAGVASDFLQLDGLPGELADGSINVLLSGAGFGGAVFELGNSIYDSGTGLIKVLSGNANAMDYIDLGINLAATGAIIATIATGGAAIPVIVAVTAGVKIAKELSKHIKNIIAAPRTLKKVASWLKKHIGNPILNFLGVYKPNIYIYSNENIEVHVKLEPYEYITESIPQYDEDEGWKAYIFSGSINGVNDYLFYEAKIPDQGLQRKEGFVIHHETLEEDMEMVLLMYGFNEKEKDDFLEYWTDKLADGKDYVFYPQYNDTLEKIMPITITPAPDNIFRIWFLIEELEEVKEFEIIHEVEKIKRLDYTVVEWGGICSK